jgi:flagellar protein FliO/FliZ
MAGPTDLTKRFPFRPPPALIGVGILVIALGLALPSLMSRPVASSGAAVSKPAQSSFENLTGNSFVDTQSEKPNLAWSFARLICGLAVVCGLCVVLTRWMGKRPLSPVGTMSVLATLTVDARCAIHLVRAGERRLLIGTDVSGVKALTELPGRFSDLDTEPAPSSAPVETLAQPLTVPNTSVVIGPVSVPTSATPSGQPNRDEIIAMLQRLRGTAETQSSTPV